jgi:hypothetical protein
MSAMPETLRMPCMHCRRAQRAQLKGWHLANFLAAHLAGTSQVRVSESPVIINTGMDLLLDGALS